MEAENKLNKNLLLKIGANVPKKPFISYFLKLESKLKKPSFMVFQIHFHRVVNVLKFVEQSPLRPELQFKSSHQFFFIFCQLKVVNRRKMKQAQFLQSYVMLIDLVYNMS